MRMMSARNSDLRVISHWVYSLYVDPELKRRRRTPWQATPSWTIISKIPFSTPSSLRTRIWLLSPWIPLEKSPWESVIRFFVSRVMSVGKMVICASKILTIFPFFGSFSCEECNEHLIAQLIFSIPTMYLLWSLCFWLPFNGIYLDWLDLWSFLFVCW